MVAGQQYHLLRICFSECYNVLEVLHLLLCIYKPSKSLKKLKSNFKSLQKLYKSNHKYSYDLVLSKSNAIPLPSSSFTKVLCRRSFHEFSEPVAMVKEIHRILNDSGTVVVIEGIATKAHEKDPYCNLPYVTPGYVIKTFRENNFKLQSQSEEIMPFDDNRKMSVLIFRKAFQ